MVQKDMLHLQLIGILSCVSCTNLGNPLVFSWVLYEVVGPMLEEGQTIPCWSMCSNSHFATLSCSGGSLRKHAETGGLVMVMWCVTLCLTDCFLVVNCTTPGKQDNKTLNSFLGFLDSSVGLSKVTIVVTPCTCKWVKASVRWLCPLSNRRL